MLQLAIRFAIRYVYGIGDMHNEAHHDYHTGNFRIDADIKDQAEQTFILLGVTPSQAVNHFYQYVAEKGRLPFSVQTTVTLENDEDIYLRLLREIRICNMHLRYAELLSEKVTSLPL